jgi:hypothetical protein
VKWLVEWEPVYQLPLGSMTRNPFDQLSKQLMEELLSPYGQVQINKEVLGEPRYIDLWFSPQPGGGPDPSILGLLGRLTTHPCLIEPFRNAPTASELESCLLKLYSIRIDSRREAKREKRQLSDEQLPHLWILTPTASQDFLQSIGGHEVEGWLAGVYFTLNAFHTRVIVIHQLPEIDETLWLRLLGKGGTQQRAIAEVLSLPTSDPRREMALRLLVSWKVTIESTGEVDLEERELAMALSQAYLEWEKKTEQRGIQQARLEDLLDTLEVLFGVVPVDLRDLLQTKDAEHLRSLHREALKCQDLDAFRTLLDA